MLQAMPFFLSNLFFLNYPKLVKKAVVSIYNINKLILFSERHAVHSIDVDHNLVVIHQCGVFYLLSNECCLWNHRHWDYKQTRFSISSPVTGLKQIIISVEYSGRFIQIPFRACHFMMSMCWTWLDVLVSVWVGGGKAEVEGERWRVHLMQTKRGNKGKEENELHDFPSGVLSDQEPQFLQPSSVLRSCCRL